MTARRKTRRCLGPACDRVLVPAAMPAQRRPPGTFPRSGRNLCHRCYVRAATNDTLADYPRINRPADEVLDDWVPLRLRGCTIGQAAEKMGMTYGALERVLILARRAGDPRAPYLVRP